MSSFLIDDDLFYCNVPVNDEGVRNLRCFIDSIEEVMYVVEHPNESIYWATYSNDRFDGIQRDDTAFPDIVKKHFHMTVSDFFNKELSKDTYTQFELDCFNSCASLCYEQIKYVYDLLLHFESYNNL